MTYLYARYTRDNIGYLTVIPVFVCLPVAIWGAISLETVLTPLPWLIVIFGAEWTTAPQITHEGLDPSILALFVRPPPTAERTLDVVSILATFFVGIAIFFYAQLSPLCLVVLTTLIAWILILARNLRKK